MEEKYICSQSVGAVIGNGHGTDGHLLDSAQCSCKSVHIDVGPSVLDHVGVGTKSTCVGMAVNFSPELSED